VGSEAGWRRVLPRLTSAAADHGAAARKSFFNDARSLTPYVSVEVEGLLFFVATNDRLGRGLFVRRWRQDLRHLKRAIRILRKHGLGQGGSTFVDVGANIGTTTVPAIRWHRFARAVALEPAPGNFRTLRLNLVANEIESSVTALQVAVSDREGDAELALSPTSSGTHVLVSFLPDERTVETLKIPTVSLDGLVERGVIEPDRVGLLWVDAAGAEGLVFAGASRILECGIPIVTAMRPTLPSWAQTKESLIRFLGGYTDFVDLRHGGKAPLDAVRPLLDSLTDDSDVLAFRRGAEGCAPTPLAYPASEQRA
jgi:FkbM family methyltransferase